MKPILTIVVPCYNEEDVLLNTMSELLKVMDRLVLEKAISKDSRLLFVDDGSTDHTWAIIETKAKKDNKVKGVKLAKNVGHQNALLAGLEAAAECSDCIISIDADLQDDVNVIAQFIHKFHEGNEVVYGVRSKRDKDTWFKRVSAESYYKLMNGFGIELVFNHADFRLMSKRAVLHLLKYTETNMFLRGIVPLVGFKTATVTYERKERLAGESKYPLKKMISFALDGLTSFTVKPIRLITAGGAIVLILGAGAGAYPLIQKAAGNTVPGWTSIMASIWFIGGVQLLSLGLIGEYIGKIFKEVKRRPKFLIEDNLLEPQTLKRHEYMKYRVRSKRKHF
ncbi:glycosyltransferase family 2 protein [Fictibacillus iocasae]|uniref:Glycosyltransferase family 2 protein n=1 Tax=Fictibacillus iocasae TaxID=2715437 RepID=A0ABW2NRR7_9BACL